AAAQRKAGQLKGAEARFDIRGGDAFIEVWVAELNPFESPRDCLGEMIQKVELKGWKHILIDGYPAARWIGTRAGGEEGIPLAEEEGNKVLDTRVTEIFLMGCNGARKWVLKMSAKTQDAAKHGPTFRRVRESIEYCAHMSLDSRTSKPKPNCQ
ncbi:MAG: hypothetical protein FWC28_01410, partial [Proteobacteria bacterium]|nr:hypothetical protein [Cystobacterineae bacterium]MCL2313897.1 hypothetical protein [Pseudomonadota bacterium]